MLTARARYIRFKSAYTDVPLNFDLLCTAQSDAPARELSRLYYLGFKGVALQLKKDENQNLNVPAANAADSVVHGVREDRRAAQSGGSVR